MITKKMVCRLRSCFALAGFLVLTPLHAEQPIQSAISDEQNPKVIAGIVSALLGNVISAGAQAVINRIAPAPQTYQGAPSYTPFQPIQGGYDQSGQIPATASPCYVTASNPNNINQAMRDELKRTGCQLITQILGSATQGIQGYVSNIVNTQGVAPVPLSYNNQGVSNYQGIKVSVILLDAAGTILGERPIGSTFYSGEKFRLRIQSSFPGILEVNHTSPSGTVKRLFPRPEIGQFLINSGIEVTLPLGNNVYEFSGDTGSEQLMFTVRDPRISQSEHLPSQVYRQDGASGSYYGQLMHSGQYPYISQSVRIAHQWR